MAIARIAFVLATAALAGGCASMRDADSASTAQLSGDRFALDADALYMQRVEQQARVRGIGVTWVNPPHRRARPAATPR